MTEAELQAAIDTVRALAKHNGFDVIMIFPDGPAQGVRGQNQCPLESPLESTNENTGRNGPAGGQPVAGNKPT